MDAKTALRLAISKWDSDKDAGAARYRAQEQAWEETARRWVEDNLGAILADVEREARAGHTQMVVRPAELQAVISANRLMVALTRRLRPMGYKVQVTGTGGVEISW